MLADLILRRGPLLLFGHFVAREIGIVPDRRDNRFGARGYAVVHVTPGFFSSTFFWSIDGSMAHVGRDVGNGSHVLGGDCPGAVAWQDPLLGEGTCP